MPALPKAAPYHINAYCCTVGRPNIIVRSNKFTDSYILYIVTQDKLSLVDMVKVLDVAYYKSIHYIIESALC